VILDINTWEGQEIKAQIVLLIRQLNYQLAKASLTGGFMAQFSTQQLFENSAEEFHPHETLSAPMKLSSPLSSSIQ
jgi:hypothetical protein